MVYLVNSFSVDRIQDISNMKGIQTMANDYRNKFVTPETAAKAVRSGDWVDYGFGAGFPELMDKALAARKEELKDVKIRGGLVIRPRIEVAECDPEQSAFTYYSWHIGEKAAEPRALPVYPHDSPFSA